MILLGEKRRFITLEDINKKVSDITKLCNRYTALGFDVLNDPSDPNRSAYSVEEIIQALYFFQDSDISIGFQSDHMYQVSHDLYGDCFLAEELLELVTYKIGIPIVDDGCLHLKKYEQRFTSFSFWYCPDCKKEVK